MQRRSFIAGLGALFVAAPAIVRAASIMPVKPVSVFGIAEYPITAPFRLDVLYGSINLAEYSEHFLLPRLRAGGLVF